MTRCRSVNEALDQIRELGGGPVEVEGILDARRSVDGALRTHEYWLLHYPAAERRPGGGQDRSMQDSRLWLEFGEGSIRPNPRALERWEGKRVRVHGIVHPPKSPSSIDPFEGNWVYHAHLEVYSVQRVTSEQRKDRS